ncbi:hypothetical protein LTR15_003573 [Elasticomyces elasticus]|nr:hypothetical protein LTR15_003573 [Elasticomyces elasticus]
MPRESFRYCLTICSTTTTTTTTTAIVQTDLTTGTDTVTASDPVITTVFEPTTVRALCLISTTPAKAKREEASVTTTIYHLVNGVPDTNKPGATVTIDTPANIKRAAKTTSTGLSTPTALKGWVSSAISSACGCLNIATPTVSSTTTIKAVVTSKSTIVVAASTTVTPTIVSSPVVTLTSTMVDTSTQTNDLAATFTSVPTITTRSTSTTTTVPNNTACSSVSGPIATASPPRTASYAAYFQGCGVRENSNNKGNTITSRPPVTAYFDGSLAACDAINQCAGAAANGLEVYYSFDLHYRISTAQYECVQYYDGNTDTAAFNVVDPDVDVTYGYAITDY